MKNWKIYGSITVVLLLIFLLCYAAMSFSYSNGERSGVVSKFSRKGLMFKTWEGELNQGSISDGGIPKVWEFSVVDSDVIEQVKASARKGDRVTLVYKEFLFINPATRSTKYLIVDVLNANGVSVGDAK